MERCGVVGLDGVEGFIVSRRLRVNNGDELKGRAANYRRCRHRVLISRRAAGDESAVGDRGWEKAEQSRFSEGARRG